MIRKKPDIMPAVWKYIRKGRFVDVIWKERY